MPCRDLDFAERDAGVQSGHDERCSEHVRMYQPDPRSLSDRPDPAVGGAPVEATYVVAHEDRAVSTFADGEIDGAGGAGDQGDESRLVALADDP